MQQGRPADNESAYRLLHKSFMQGEHITSAAFKGATSVWIKERLPNQDGTILERGSFTSWGRARLSLELIRATDSPSQDGKTRVNCGFDVELTPDGASEEFRDIKDAHGDLTGRLRGAAASALAARFDTLGVKEKLPDP